MIQVYGRRKCRSTQKALRFFSERGIPVQNIDLDQRAPGRREIELFVQTVGTETLLDTESRLYRERGLAYMEFDPAVELEESPNLLRTPIVRSGRDIVVGDDERAWKRLTSGSGR